MKILTFNSLFSIFLLFFVSFYLETKSAKYVKDASNNNLNENKEENKDGNNQSQYFQELYEKPKRSFNSLIQYLKDLREKRKTSYVLNIEMKAWIKFALTKVNADNQDKNESNHTNHTNNTNNEENNGEDETTTHMPNKNETKKFVYNNTVFIELCNDPVFTTVDSNLDGSEILIFKNDKFYVMEDLRYGSGKLVASGLTRELLPKFDSNKLASIVTIIEGPMRGYIFAFYKNQERAGWAPVGSFSVKHNNEIKKSSVGTLPKNGFQTALHNRDINNPLLIGINGEMVYYYKIEKNSIIKVKEITNDKSDEKFPPRITAAFSMPNGYVYLFRDKQYCVRELKYDVQNNGNKEYCDIWLDSRLFLGCYGQYPPPYSMEAENLSLFNERVEKTSQQFCNSLDNLKLGLSIDRHTVMAFSENKYWKVEHFPQKPKIEEKNWPSNKWKEIETNFDAFMVVSEGKSLRGNLFVFKNEKYKQWSDKNKLLKKNEKIEKFNAIIHNSDVVNPMAVAFNKNLVYYYSTNFNEIKLIKTVNYNESNENWPKHITTGFTINSHNIYIFKGNKYCLRQWECSDKTTNCCKNWLDASKLFHCSEENDSSTESSN